MNNLVKDETNIEKLIYEIRGVQVMLDSDLARLYECANGTKTINQAIKRNLERVPNDFYFQLTKEELFDLKSKLRLQVGMIVALSKKLNGSNWKLKIINK